jgi:hypothetical protein
MIQAGNGASFTLESFAQFGTIRKMRWQNLDGDDSVKPRIASAINLTHPAGAYAGEDFVGPETLPEKDRHGFPANAKLMQYNA